MEQRQRRLSIPDGWRSRREWLRPSQGRHDWIQRCHNHWTRLRRTRRRFRPKTVLVRWSVWIECMGRGSVGHWHCSWVPGMSRYRGIHNSVVSAVWQRQSSWQRLRFSLNSVENSPWWLTLIWNKCQLPDLVSLSRFSLELDTGYFISPNLNFQPLPPFLPLTLSFTVNFLCEDFSNL